MDKLKRFICFGVVIGHDKLLRSQPIDEFLGATFDSERFIVAMY